MKLIVTSQSLPKKRIVDDYEDFEWRIKSLSSHTPNRIHSECMTLTSSNWYFYFEMGKKKIQDLCFKKKKLSKGIVVRFDVASDYHEWKSASSCELHLPSDNTKSCRRFSAPSNVKQHSNRAHNSDLRLSVFQAAHKQSLCIYINRHVKNDEAKYHHVVWNWCNRRRSLLVVVWELLRDAMPIKGCFGNRCCSSRLIHEKCFVYELIFCRFLTCSGWECLTFRLLCVLSSRFSNASAYTLRSA